MPRLGESRRTLLEVLADHPGKSPGPVGFAGSTPFEAIVRVALGLVAEPRAASAALDALRDAGMLEPATLAELDPLELDDTFRHARVRLTSKSLNPLRKIARWAVDRALDAESLDDLPTEAIREEWRGLNGVGPATADALLLFALGRPTIPVDRASYRILVRHGWLDPSSDYDEARSVLEGIDPDNPEGLARLSLAFERVGREFCKPSSPRCDRCPLRTLLPEGGPIEES